MENNYTSLLENHLEIFDFKQCIQEKGNTEDQNMVCLILFVAYFVCCHEVQLQIQKRAEGNDYAIKEGFLNSFIRKQGTKKIAGGHNNDYIAVMELCCAATIVEHPDWAISNRTLRRYFLRTREGVQISYEAPEAHLDGWTPRSFYPKNNFNPICIFDLKINLTELELKAHFTKRSKLWSFFNFQIKLTKEQMELFEDQAFAMSRRIAEYAFDASTRIEEREEDCVGGCKIPALIKPMALLRFFAIELLREEKDSQVPTGFKFWKFEEYFGTPPEER
jgi:hypothetical protein